MHKKQFNRLLFPMMLIPYISYVFDLSRIFVSYTRLGDAARLITEKTAVTGRLDYEDIMRHENKENFTFTCLSNCHPRYGDTVVFVMEKKIFTVIVRSPVFTIRLEKEIVIGYM